MTGRATGGGSAAHSSGAGQQEIRVGGKLAYEPEDPNFEERVRRSFARQRVMELLGATLAGVSPGRVDISLPFREDLTQQHGFIHAGIVAAIADSACGYAALTLMPPEAAVLTVEYKLNLLLPASGTLVLARGRVTKAGRTLSVCHADVVADPEGGGKLVATMLSTMMTVTNRGLID